MIDERGLTPSQSYDSEDGKSEPIEIDLLGIPTELFRSENQNSKVVNFPDEENVRSIELVLEDYTNI